MIEQLLGSPSFFRIFLQRFWYKVTELGCPFEVVQLRWWVLRNFESYHALRLLHIRRKACCEFISQDTERPHIDADVVVLVLQHLRRHPVQCSLYFIPCWFIPGKPFSKAEVTQFDVSFQTDEDVLWLDVSVHDILIMEVRKPFQHGLTNVSTKVFWKIPFLMIDYVCDRLRWHQLKEYPSFCLEFVALVALDDVFGFTAHHDFSFVHDTLLYKRIRCKFVDYLHSYWFVVR